MNVLHSLCVTQPKKMLENLERWLDKAEAWAKERAFDPELYLGFRLAPDQFPLLEQIQSACDNAKFVAARVAGKQPPSHPDDEQTLAQIRQRIQSVKQYLDGFVPEDFAGAEDRRVTLPFLEGHQLTALDYAREMALPNFNFHLVHAYAILRHAGVPLGKRDYIGSLTFAEG